MLNKTHGIYTVTKSKPFLAGMPHPGHGDSTIWNTLHELGFTSVVCLTDNEPSYTASPLKVLASVRLQDLYGGRKPDDPEMEETLIRQVVRKIVEAHKNGESIVVHCAGGTGRTGTVLSLTLRELGQPAEQVLATMDNLNRDRRRASSGWPESEWQKTLIQ